MNPILKILNQSKGRQSKNSNLFQLVNDVKAGKVDTKQKSIEMLQSMTADQKKAVTQILPTLLKVGKAFGISDNNIQTFTNELNEVLRRGS